jgi:hypothetical protein
MRRPTSWGVSHSTAVDSVDSVDVRSVPSDGLQRVSPSGVVAGDDVP